MSEFAESCEGLNPLLVESILENVFLYVPTIHLQPCKLVCKLWNEVSCEAQRNRELIEINSMDMAETVYVLLKEDPQWSISSITFKEINLNSSVVKWIFTNLKNTLHILRLKSGVMEEEALHDYMRLIGENLMTLELQLLHDGYFGFFPLLPIPKEMGSSEILIFKQLRTLDIIGHEMLPYSHSAGRTYLSQVVRSCPNLVNLTMHNVLDEHPNEFEGLRMPQLEYLKLNMMPIDAPSIYKGIGLSTCIVKCLMKLKLNLKDIRIFNVRKDLDACVFREFLESQGQSLETLFLIQNRFGASSASAEGPQYCNEPLPTPFPLILPKLNRLQVYKPFVRNLQHIFNSTPSLYSIIISFDPDVQWKSVLTNTELHPADSLRKLTITNVDPFSLKRMAVFAEQLTRLTIMNCGDALMEVIFDKFSNLVELNLYQGSGFAGRITDSGISGLDSKVLEKFEHILTKNGNENVPITKELAMLIDSSRTKPSLAKMKSMLLIKHFMFACGISDNFIFILLIIILIGVRHLILVFNTPCKFQMLWGLWNLEVMHTMNLNVESIVNHTQFTSFMRRCGRYAFSGENEVKIKCGFNTYMRDDSLIILGSSPRRLRNLDAPEDMTSFDAWKYDLENTDSKNMCLELQEHLQKMKI